MSTQENPGTTSAEALTWLLCDYAELPAPEYNAVVEVSSKTSFKVAVAWPDLRMALVANSEQLKRMPHFKWTVSRLPKSLLTTGPFLKDWIMEVTSMIRDPDYEPVKHLVREGEAGNIPSPMLKVLLRLMQMEYPELPQPKAVQKGHLVWDALTFMTSPTASPVGGQVFWMPDTKVAALTEALHDINTLKFSAVVASADNEADATVSRSEGRLLDAMTRVGLPAPNRNREFYWPETGEIATVPDFVWEHAKFVVELDGYYFHKGLHLSEGIKAVLEEDPERATEIKNKAQDRAVKDAKKRRLLGLMGWSVQMVHDVEITSDKAAMSLAREIKEMLSVREIQLGIRQQPKTPAAPPAMPPAAP